MQAPSASKCERCKRPLTEPTPEEHEKMLQEAKVTWNMTPDTGDMVLLCNDCYQEVMKSFN